MKINQLLQQLSSADTQSPTASGINGKSLAAGAALGGIAGFLANSPTGRRLGRKALRHGRTAAGFGGLALIGGVAFKTLSSISGTAEASAVSENAALETDPMLILRAMIAAAQADGEIDSDEETRLFGQMQEANASPEQRILVTAELESPMTPAQLAAACRNPADRSAVYAAASMAIDVDTAAESAFMAALANTLELDSALVTAIEQQLKV